MREDPQEPNLFVVHTVRAMPKKKAWASSGLRICSTPERASLVFWLLLLLQAHGTLLNPVALLAADCTME